MCYKQLTSKYGGFLKDSTPQGLKKKIRRQGEYNMSQYHTQCREPKTQTHFKLTFLIIIIIISNLSNERSKASSKMIPPHSAI